MDLSDILGKNQTSPLFVESFLLPPAGKISILFQVEIAG